MTKKTIHVVAAVICDENGNVLIAKRPKDVHQGGLWEFPGGKVESGEQAAQALVRELQEELAITATEYRPLIQIHHDYPDKSVFLDVWKVTQFVGEPIGSGGLGAEKQPVQWVPSVELHHWAFPAANAAIVKAAQLPSDYVITHDVSDAARAGEEESDSEGNSGGNSSDKIAVFLHGVEAVLIRGYQLIQLRTKSLDKNQQQAVTSQVLSLCQQFNAVLMINSDLDFTSDSALISADISNVGLHLTGRAMNECNEKPIGYRFVAASCHSATDIRQAELLGLDFVTLSPVSQTTSHPGAKELGWPIFADIVKGACIPVYALGGMTEECRGKAIDSGAQGIASISAYGS